MDLQPASHHRVAASSGSSGASIRRANLGLLLSHVHRRGVVSRSELVAATGLTRSAILGLVGALGDEGLVSESRAVSGGSPGRPSPYIRPVATAAVALAFEVAVDSITAATVGLGGGVLERIRVDRSRHASVDDTIDSVVALGQDVLRRLHRTTRLVGVGVAVAGQVSRRDGFVTLAPNLGWRDVALGSMLRDRLALTVPLTVGNEAQLGALAEHTRGAAMGCDDVVYVAGEVGVGGGVILGGRPVIGASGAAGEVGHMVVNPEGRACRCGSRGCWETEVSEGALLVRAGLPSNAGRAAIDRVLISAAAGDDVSRQALDDTQRWVARGLVSLVNLINPQRVVLGGYLAQAFPRWEADLLAAVRDAALPSSRQDLLIVPALLGADAPILGAAEVAFEALFARPLRTEVEAARA